MKWFLKTLLTGLLVVAPVYLAVLLLAGATKKVLGIVRPVAVFIPDWFPGEDLLALLFVLAFCILVGAAVATHQGRAVLEKAERALFERLPGYAVLRGLTQQLAGGGRDAEANWKPALVEIEEALVPGFVIEELADGRFTVFVPSVPTPMAGAVYVLTPERVHVVDVKFTHAVKTISRWGSGMGELVAAMEQAPAAPERKPA
jgi:uncharacterized membrane protein